MKLLCGYLCAVVYACLCIGFAALLYKFGLPKPYSRKTVHILVGFEWAILTAFFGVGIHFLIVCAVFTAGLYMDYKKSLLPLMSSDGDNAPGTVFYGVSMTVMALACLFLPDLLYPFGIAVFCTSFGDGAAGVIGQAVKAHNPKIYGNKSLLGSLACFVFSFLSAWIIREIFTLALPFYSLPMIAFFASEIELLAFRGLDNILLPLGVCALSYGFISYSGMLLYIVPILATTIVIALVKRKQLLTNAGICAAVIMDIIVSLAFGNAGFILLLFFLIGGAVVDRFKKRYRKFADETEKNSDQRDVIQVLANGALPMLIALLSLAHDGFFFGVFFATVYTSVLAEAFADTCASGFGAASKRTFDPFRRRDVSGGLSGGMSVLGTAASLLAAFAVSLLSFLLNAVTLRYALLAGACGFLGALFDSFLGSVIQVKYRCGICGKLTEKRTHCGKATDYAFGLRAVNNDLVNLLSGGFTMIVCGLIVFLTV